MRTAIVNGRVMTTTEILQWIAENRDYTVCRHTMLTRMRDGKTGEDLIAPASHAWRKGQSARHKRERTEQQRENERRYKAKKRAERDMWKNFYAWPRVEHGG